MKADILANLLSSAAKAHGNLRFVQRRGWFHVKRDGTNGALWDPSDDDGDALRLAVMLGIEIRYFRGEAHARFEKLIWKTETFGGLKFAAMRLAILRAAADLGERMP